MLGERKLTKLLLTAKVTFWQQPMILDRLAHKLINIGFLRN